MTLNCSLTVLVQTLSENFIIKVVHVILKTLVAELLLRLKIVVMLVLVIS